jgi:hypothetical protein
MNKIFFGLILVVSIASCSNEIDLFAEWQDIPVVFGLVESSDTDQYLRIERVFQGENGSAFDAANNVDSIYYDNLIATITNNSTGETKNLVKTEVSAVQGWVRNEGLFVSDPNFLYKLDADSFSFNPGDELVLELYNNQDDTPFSVATTKVLQPVDYLDNSGGILSFRPGKLTSFIFEHGPNAKLFDLIIYINLVEYDQGTDVLTEKTLKWTVRKGVNITEANSSFYSYNVPGDGFYSFLLSELEADPAIQRFFGTMDLEIVVGGSELQEFNEIALVNTGITSAQEIPTYSNLSHGLGIFSSKATEVVDGLVLSEVAKDTLRNSALTAELNFQ